MSWTIPFGWQAKPASRASITTKIFNPRFMLNDIRPLCPRFTDVKQNPLLMNGEYLSIGPHDLKSIIVGCRAKDDAIQAIKGLVQEHAQHVAVRYARRALDKYDLVIED